MSGRAYPRAPSCRSVGYRGETQFEDRIHLCNRDYDPTTATFLTPDPLGVDAEPPGRPSSGNLYAYVGNDPLNHTDPLGLCRMADGDFVFEQNRDICENAQANSASTSGCFWGGSELTFYDWDPFNTVSYQQGSDCKVHHGDGSVFGEWWTVPGDSIAKQLADRYDWLPWDCGVRDVGCDVNHLVVSAEVCPIICIGIQHQDGHWIFTWGEVGYGAGVGVGAANLHVCDREENAVGGAAGPVYGTMGSDGSLNEDDWEWGSVFGLKFSASGGASQGEKLIGDCG